MIHQIHIVTRFETFTDPADLYAEALRIKNGMVAQALVYSGPTPTTADVTTNLGNLSDKIAAWGTPPNHGTTNDHVALLASVEVIKQNLRDWVHYCELTTPNSAPDFTAVGWAITHSSSPIGALPGPANLRVVLPQGRRLIQGRLHYRWNPVPGAHSYNVWTGTGAIISIPPDTNLPHQTVTAAAYDDTAASGTSRWIIVGCVGADPTTGYTGLSGNIVP